MGQTADTLAPSGLFAQAQRNAVKVGGEKGLSSDSIERVQVDERRPFRFFFRALALRRRDFLSLAFRAALRRAVLRRLLACFMADSFSIVSNSQGAHSVWSCPRDQVYLPDFVFFLKKPTVIDLCNGKISFFLIQIKIIDPLRISRYDPIAANFKRWSQQRLLS